jgi:hypothetical protein
MDSVATLTAGLTHWLRRLMPAGQRLDDLLAAVDGGQRTGAQHLSDVVYRDRRRQWWTDPGPALTVPAAVLVSGDTYSSAEALAYHLQARGRVTVLGERTRGTADHITPIRLVPQGAGVPAGGVRAGRRHRWQLGADRRDPRRRVPGRRGARPVARVNRSP